jgi:hypothetical protein
MSTLPVLAPELPDFAFEALGSQFFGWDSLAYP